MNPLLWHRNWTCQPLSATDVGEEAMNQTRRAIYCRNLFLPENKTAIQDPYSSSMPTRWSITRLLLSSSKIDSAITAKKVFWRKSDSPVIAHRIYCYDCYDFRLFSPKWCNDSKAHLKHHSICDSIENFSLDSSSPRSPFFHDSLISRTIASFKFTYSAQCLFIFIGDDEKMKCAKGKNERTNLVKLQVIQSNDE